MAAITRVGAEVNPNFGEAHDSFSLRFFVELDDGRFVIDPGMQSSGVTLTKPTRETLDETARMSMVSGTGMDRLLDQLRLHGVEADGQALLAAPFELRPSLFVQDRLT
jgi:hypothetical protein